MSYMSCGLQANIRRSRFIPQLLLLLFAIIVQPVFPLYASQVVLDEIAISTGVVTTTYNINFGLPLEYQKHFPRNVGEIVQIQLKLLDKEVDRVLHKEVREGGELVAPESGESVLVYVTYEEGVPGGPYLTLRFSHPVRFDVRPGPNRMSVAVIVYDDKEDEKKSDDSADLKKKSGRPVDLMMAKARQSITFGNNKGAIDLLRKIIRKKNHDHVQEASELLGLALERDSQIPRAKYEYRKYLKSYTEGEGAARVRQRLAALREIRPKLKRKLRRSKKAKRRDKIRTFGRLTQAYSEYYVDRELEGLAEEIEQELQQRLLSSNFSVKSRYRSEDRTVIGVFNASHSRDFLAGTTGREDDDRDESDIRRMYIDLDDHKYKVVGKVGRQSSRNGGVFGTFDGVVAGYRITPRWLASVTTGKPIIRTFSDLDIYEKSFFGVKFDVTSEDKKFSNNVFFVQQEVDGILDRKAIGGDIRYAKKGLSIFGLIDYDLYFSDISLFNFRVGWNYTKSNKLNFSYNHRQLFMTSNALQSMSVTTIDGLLDFLPEKEIHDIAKDRTAANDTLTIGNSYQINKDQQFNADVTVLETSSLKESSDPVDLDVIPAQEASGKQFIYSLQWISSNTFVKRDLYVVGMRRSEFSRYTDNSVFVNTRVPINKQWRSGFRLNLSKRDSTSFGARSTISPLIKLNYRMSKSWSFDSELGFDFVKNENTPNEVRTRGRIAYHYTF
jgi:hypothetical protein